MVVKYDDRFAELYKIIEPYLYTDRTKMCLALRDDASDEVKKAYKEWIKYE